MRGKRFFAASNTSRGFVSYFAENFRERADRCYIIKGGPGTGKSRLMSEMADAFCDSGGDVEYYFCSSDPTSLDGLFVKCDGYSVAVVDGTAPHAEDIYYPGVKDNIIDVGRFWDPRILREAKNEINLFTGRKSRAYSSAYRALAAYGALRELSDALAAEAADAGVIADQCARLAEELPHGRLLRTPLSAVGMRGRVDYDSFSESAELTLTITDSRAYGISHLYFDRLVAAIGGRAAPDPILPSRYTAMMAGGVAVKDAYVGNAGGGAIDVSEFVDRSLYLMNKERIDRLRLLADSALAEALDFFAEAGEAHMNIEKIFASAMNFGEKEAYSSELCDKIRKGYL